MTAGDLFLGARDLAHAQNDQNPFVAIDSAGALFAVGTEYKPIYFPIKSKYTKTRFRRSKSWFLSPLNGPFQDLQIPISEEELERLLEQMQNSGKTLNSVLNEVP